MRARVQNKEQKEIFLNYVLFKLLRHILLKQWILKKIKTMKVTV